MRIKTQCGHEFDTPWKDGFVRFGPFFYCEVCGSAQAIPVETLDNGGSGGYAETRNANEYYAEQGWPTVPDTLEKALEGEVEGGVAT